MGPIQDAEDLEEEKAVMLIDQLMDEETTETWIVEEDDFIWWQEDDELGQYYDEEYDEEEDNPKASIRKTPKRSPLKVSKELPKDEVVLRPPVMQESPKQHKNLPFKNILT